MILEEIFSMCLKESPGMFKWFFTAFVLQGEPLRCDDKTVSNKDDWTEFLLLLSWNTWQWDFGPEDKHVVSAKKPLGWRFIWLLKCKTRTTLKIANCHKRVIAGNQVAGASMTALGNLRDGQSRLINMYYFTPPVELLRLATLMWA